MSCGFVGNSDIYGIGIRIGYYTQAIAVWFSNFFLLREAKSLRAVNNLFLFALVVAGFIYAQDARGTYAVEAFLLLQIGLCLLFVSVMECTRYSTRYLKLSPERLAIRTLVLNAGMLFNILFWWHGLDIMRETPCVGAGDASSTAGSDRTGHGTYACYVVRADMYGWMRTAMKVLSLSLFIWRTLRTTNYDMLRTFHRLRMKETRAAFIQVASDINQSKCLAVVKKDPAENTTHDSSRAALVEPLNDPGKKSRTFSMPRDGNQPYINIHNDRIRSATTTIFRRSSQSSQTRLNQTLNVQSSAEALEQRSGTVKHCPPFRPQEESRIDRSPQAKSDSSASGQETQIHKPELRDQEPSPRLNPATSRSKADQRPNSFHSSLPRSPASHHQAFRRDITFEKVLEADTYLTSVLSILPPPPPPRKLRFGRLSSSKRVTTAPKAASPPALTSPSTSLLSYMQSLLITFRANFTNNPPFSLSLTLSLHISALQQYSSRHWPQLVERLRNDFHPHSPSPSPSPHRPSPPSNPSLLHPSPSSSPALAPGPTPAVSSSSSSSPPPPPSSPSLPSSPFQAPSPSPSSTPASPPLPPSLQSAPQSPSLTLPQPSPTPPIPPLQPSWPLLALASDIQLSLMPLTISASIWTLMAIETFVIIVILVVQVELTIAWNHVSGLQTLNTIGQLIPCILGVGGLAQVLWGKGKGVVRGEDERIDGTLGAGNEYESAMATFVAWKKDREKEENIPGGIC